MLNHYGLHLEFTERGVPKIVDVNGLPLRIALELADHYSTNSHMFDEGFAFGRAEISRQGMPLLGLEPEMMAGPYGDFIDTGARRWHAIGEDMLEP